VTELAHGECMGDAEQHLAASTVDIILLDLGLPDAQGLDAVWRARAAAPSIPLVVLTGLDDESLATRPPDHHNSKRDHHCDGSDQHGAKPEAAHHR
jgi:CheY-like chemotaxis protein